MADFHEQLLRLKEALGLAEDQQVADALGMTAQAFSARKGRGSFPEGKVVAAKARFPALDVGYVLTGKRSETPSRRALEAAAALSAKQPLVIQEAAAAAYHLHALQEASAADKQQSLQEILRWCDDDAIDLITRMAARLAKAKPQKKGAA